jgi:hypothetical protein
VTKTKSDDDEVKKVIFSHTGRFQGRDEARRRLFVDSRKFPGANQLPHRDNVAGRIRSSQFSVPI